MNDVAAIYAGPQPELSDGAVTLTALRGSDAPALVISDNDAQTARWFGWPVRASTLENTSEFVQLAARRWSGDHAHVNVSYTTFPAARGRGLAARAVDVACRFAFAHLGVHRVQLLAEPPTPRRYASPRRPDSRVKECCATTRTTADGTATCHALTACTDLLPDADAR